MKVQLLAFAKLYREKFEVENLAPQDDMFILVKSGSFKFLQNGTQYTVEKNQGAFLRKGELCKRSIIAPAVMYLFRYVSDLPLFKSVEVHFSDTERLASNMEMLDKSEGLAERSSIYEHILSDLSLQCAMDARHAYQKSGVLFDRLIDRVISRMKEEIDRKIIEAYYDFIGT